MSSSRRPRKTPPKPKKPEAPAPDPSKLRFMVEVPVMQNTVDFLRALSLAHPASVTRDQLVQHFGSLTAVEVQKDNAGKSKSS